MRREISVSCLPNKLIDHIDVDVSALDIGESIHIQDIDLPDGIKITQEDHLTIAVVLAPTVAPEKIEEEEEEEITEEEGTETESESV